jgi:hypothetical protein
VYGVYREGASSVSTRSTKAVKKMSLADCFAAALAKEKKADLYTGDP